MPYGFALLMMDVFLTILQARSNIKASSKVTICVVKFVYLRFLIFNNILLYIVQFIKKYISIFVAVKYIASNTVIVSHLAMFVLPKLSVKPGFH